jgi:hypothetical protein
MASDLLARRIVRVRGALVLEASGVMAVDSRQ